MKKTQQELQYEPEDVGVSCQICGLRWALRKWTTCRQCYSKGRPR